MKKLILAIAAFAAMSISASAAEVTGSILSTDIGTLIDGAPCKTYNVDGRTFVIAEDLRGYGFDVVYDDSIRRLTITQNPYSERTILSKEEINILKNSVTVGQWLGDMFATDITVYLGNEQIEGYAIDGKMVIPVRALERCAYVEYSDSYRLVLVNALQHYLTERHIQAPDTLLYTINEENVNFYYRHKAINGSILMSDSFSYDGVSKITTASINDGQKSISARWGNPYYIDSPSTRNEWCVPYRMEVYTIKDEQQNIIYDTFINRNYNLIDEELRFSTNSGYISNGIISLPIGIGGGMLYSTKIAEANDYTPSFYNYWPSLSNSENIKIEKLSSYGDCFITDNGYLCSISNTPEIIRYNILDQPTRNYYLANDNKLYEKTTSVFSNRTNSRFDECIENNVKKMVFLSGDNTYLTLKTNGNVFYKSQHLPIASNVRDFSAANITGYLYIAIAAIDKNDDLYIAGYNDIGNIVDTDVKYAYVYDDRLGGMVYYVKNNGELYSYSLKTWSGEKIANDIKEIVNNELFITTNDELTDLTNIQATNVKDASNSYILTNDNTIIERTTGEQIFPK